MYGKHFENRFTNKNLMLKNVFEYGFCLGKEDNPKILYFRFWQIVNFTQTFGHLVSFSYNLVLVYEFLIKC